MTGRRYGWAMAAALVTGACALPQAALAQEEAEAPGPNTGKIHLAAGMDVYSQYFFRGILQENQGFIGQPWAEITAELFEFDGPINAINAHVGIWNSFHSVNNPGGGANSVDSWYEADLYGGISAEMFDGMMTATVLYTALTAPGNQFSTIQEISVGLEMDDKQLWHDAGFDMMDFAGFRPSILVAFEFDDGADGTNGAAMTGFDEGVYLEIGLNPGFTLVEDLDLTVSMPTKLGLSIEDYYQADTNGDGIADNDDLFGYVKTGLEFGLPLKFIPQDYGMWSARAGVDVYFLGGNTEFVNNNDDIEIVGFIGFGMEY